VGGFDGGRTGVRALDGGVVDPDERLELWAFVLKVEAVAIAAGLLLWLVW